MSSSNSETSAAGAWSGQRLFALICVVLALGTAALYWPITHHPFIIFDDLQYVVDNPHVNSGLSGTNFVWAFTTSEQANWHPLTWLSHQLDCTMFGVEAGGHHLVNLLYHVANTLLLFVFLRGATGTLWRSGFVAALFAWHPMHVESVAWAAERKDVLSTFFWLLAMLAYFGYVRSVKSGGPVQGLHPSSPPPGEKAGMRGPLAQKVLSKQYDFDKATGMSAPHHDQRCAAFYYISALVFCACGLMSKPMVVTLPFALLLLDYWPFNRIAGFQFEASESKDGCRPVSLARLVLEKIPFFALVIAGSLATYLAQSGGGAVSKIHVGERLANAVLAYARYTAKLFWPTDLAVVYPHPRHWPVVWALGAVALLLVWTTSCVFYWRKRPYLAVGWFWFLGTLVPTIGLIQVGAQAMADRYTYIPSIGLFVVVTWGAVEFFASRGSGKVILPLLGGAVLAGCLGATCLQISLWRDTITLFRHAIEVTTDNYAAENVLGKAYERAGDNTYALACYRQAVETEPRFPQSQFNLAMCLLTLGQTDEAFEHLQAAAALEQRDPDIQFDLGIYFSQHGGWTNAVGCFSNSVAVRPSYAPAQLALGGALANVGQPAGAASHLREALRLDPSLRQAQTNLDRLLTEHPELR